MNFFRNGIWFATALELAGCGNILAKSDNSEHKLRGENAQPEVTNDSTQDLCYELSIDGMNWNENRDLLCVERTHQKHRFTLKTKLRESEMLHSQWWLTLLSHSQYSGWNNDRFGLADEGGPDIYQTALCQLNIEFKGKHLTYPQYSNEEGTVRIGSVEYFYRTHH